MASCEALHDHAEEIASEIFDAVVDPANVCSMAIAAEVIGTSCLKLSDGFSRLWPSVVVLLAYSTSMLLLSQVVKTIPLGITYAMWSGIGIVAIVVVGVLAYRQTPTAMQLFGMALIAAGVVTVNVSGPGHG